jgi:cytochrome c oxidase subunit 3
VVAYVVVRLRSGPWPPPGLPPLPSGLGVSTALLVAADVALETAARSVVPLRPGRLRMTLMAALLLSLAFLGSQVACWIRFVMATSSVTLYGWLFFFVTGLHAVHVLGGIVPLVIATVNAWHDRFPASRDGAVRVCAVYWHFLGVVWLTIWLMLAWST